MLLSAAHFIKIFGTAARPVLDVLCGKNCTNALLTVTRWFGGTLLGTGGRRDALNAPPQVLIEHNVANNNDPTGLKEVNGFINSFTHGYSFQTAREQTSVIQVAPAPVLCSLFGTLERVFP